MLCARRPSPQAIERFIAESQALPYSYDNVGFSRQLPSHGRNAPVRGDLDETVADIGMGAADFERARSALAAWKHFDLGWVELLPQHAAPAPGAVVAVLIRHLGFWSLNGARVVYSLASDPDGDRFGFAYGTLVNHAETGEELFEVFRDPRSNQVFYRIRAVSWPRTLVSRLGYPVIRVFQARFRRASVEAMRRAMKDPA